MSGQLVLSLDVGTSGVRCLIFDSAGEQVAGGLSTLQYFTPQDAPAIAREFDPRSAWGLVCRLIRETMKNGSLTAELISAVGVTSQRQGMVFLDRAGNELYAGPNLDIRAVFEGASIDAEMGRRMKLATGHLPSFFFAPSKLKWFREHRPELYEKIAVVFTVGDWVSWKLTGEASCETTLAGEAGLLDIGTREWCEGILSELDISTSVLAPLREAEASIGQLSEAASRETGLRPGTPVVTAGADTQCGLLGLGASEDGQVGIVCGWSAPLQMVASRPIITDDGRSWTGCYQFRDKWVLECNPGDVGNSYEWLKNLLLDSAADPFSAMDRLAERVTPGSEGAMAFLGASSMDTHRLGLRTGGMLFPVPLTFEAATQGQVIRSALEASACAIRANLQQLQDISGTQARDVRVGGGMTRSRVFVQIMADVLGREVLVSSNPQVSAIGAARAAGEIGQDGVLSDSLKGPYVSLNAIEPDPLRAAEYEEHYGHWLEVSSSLEAL